MNKQPGVFQDRKTVIMFDDYLPGVVQSWTAIQRDARQMVQSTVARSENCVLTPGIGWQLKSHALGPGEIQEIEAAQSSIQTIADGNITPAPTMAAFKTFAQAVLDGVTYSPQVAERGSDFLQKLIPAGDSWAQSLSADQVAFPGPTPEQDATDLDRMFRTTYNHEPWDGINFQIWIPGSVFSSHGPLFTIYFCGPAGSDQAAQSDPDLMGTGMYALKCRSDGNAELYERLVDTTWLSRFQFRWATDSEQSAPWTVCNIGIISDCMQDGDGVFTGRRICFRPRSSTRGLFGSQVYNVASMARLYLEDKLNVTPVYTVPRITNEPTTLAPIRFDMRRDVRASFQLSKFGYEEAGSILDDVLSLDQVITDTGDTTYDLYLYWRSRAPDGTSLDAYLAEADGTPLVASTAVIEHGEFKEQGFTPVGGMRYVRAGFDFTSDTNHSPTLLEYAIYREPLTTTENPLTPYEIPARATPPSLFAQEIVDLRIMPQESEPSQESATIVINDFTGDLSALRDRSMVPIQVYVEDEVTLDYMLVFSGYVLEANGEMHRGNEAERDYPSIYWETFTLQCVGEWARLSEAITQRRYNWSVDPRTGGVWKVTDVVRRLLTTVYPEDMVIVPDIDITLLSISATQQSDIYIMEPGTRIGDAVKSLLEDFLGAYLVFDLGAGTRGAWRVLEQKHAPYNNLVYFEIDHPGAGKLPHVSAAYGTTTVDGQLIQKTFVQAGTAFQHNIPAEGNIVMTYGGASGDQAASRGTQGGTMLSQVAYSVASFNFLGLPPDHEHYPNGSSPQYYGRIVPIKVIDYTLASQAAVDWKTRRVYEKACFARTFRRFRAPLVAVTDATDASQVRPRTLRYYDPVGYRERDGTLRQYLVLSCQPAYRKDRVQMADYVLVRQENIDTIGVMPRSYTPYSMLNKALARLYGTGDPVDQRFAPQRLSANQNSDIMTLPELTSPPIQDLDPDSETFGEFYFMLDYDPLGGGEPIG